MKTDYSPKIILILGMHRSGTSLLAQLIAKWGAYMGDNLMPANSYNQDGYWEYNPLVDFHEKLLQYTNNKWFAPSEEIDTRNLLLKFGDEARQLVKNMDNRANIWCWKDPRMPIFLEFWMEILAGREIIYIISNRPPNDIATSLFVRDTMPASIALALWEFTIWNIFRALSSQKYYKFIDYDKIINEPEILCKELFDYLNKVFQLPETYEIYEEMVQSVKKSLNHAKPGILFSLSSNHKMLLKIIEQEHIPVDFGTSENQIWFLKEMFSIYRKLIFNNQNLHFAQLFFKNECNEYNENNSLIIEIAGHPKKLCFKFDNFEEVNQLRFDPINDYAHIRIQSIQLFNQGKLIESSMISTSNALSVENSEYLFDTSDPQIFIDSPQNKPIEIDEVIIDLEYLNLGVKVMPLILKFKQQNIEQKEGQIAILSELLQNSESQKELIKVDLARKSEFGKLLEVKIGGLMKEIENLDQKVSYLNEVVGEKEKKLAFSLHETEALKKDMIFKNERYQKLEQNISNLIEKIEGMNQQHEYLNKALDDKEEQLFFSKYETEELKNEINFKNEHYQKLEQQIGEINRMVSSLQNSNDENLNQINELNMQLKLKYAELLMIKKSFSFRLSRMLLIPMLVFRPSRLIRLIRARIYILRNTQLIKQSGLFDEMFYIEQNQDVKTSGMSPTRHYLLFGSFEGRNPSEKFDSRFYLEQNPDVKASGINPLVHYLKFGVKEGRSPIPGKNPQACELQQITAPSKSKIIITGAKIIQRIKGYPDLQLLRNSEYFNAEYYLRMNPDVKAAGIDPAEHYLYHGWKEGRSAGGKFDSHFYLNAYPDIKDSGICPLLHFVKNGKSEGRLPKPFVIDEVQCLKQADISRLDADLMPNDDLKIAVICHLFYIDLAEEILSYIRNIPVSYDLYLTTSEQNLEPLKEIVLRELPNVNYAIQSVPNRGRDIAPFIIALQKHLHKYGLVCKIQTKKSNHDYNLLHWRKYLLDNLLGSREIIFQIIDSFERNANLGMIYPLTYPYLTHIGLGKGWGSLSSKEQNLELARSFFSELAPETLPVDFNFPVGSMFWFRPEALKHFINKQIDINDFPEEKNQIDATLAHVIERLFEVVCNKSGYVSKTTFFPSSAISPKPVGQSMPDQFKMSILFIAHDLFRAGAEIVLLNILRWFAQHTAIKSTVVAITRGNDGGKKSGVNPLVHYLLHGKDEKRQIKSIASVEELKERWKAKKYNRYDELSNAEILKFKGSASILFIGHDGGIGGGQMLLLSLAKWFYRNTGIDFKIILLTGGVLVEKYHAIAPTLVWDDCEKYYPARDDFSATIREFIGNIDLVYGNTMVSSIIYDQLSYLNVPVITHVHELEKTISLYESTAATKNMRQFTSMFLVASNPVAENLMHNHGIAPDKIMMVPDFIETRDLDFDSSKNELRKKLELPNDGLLIIGAGSITWRKGMDMFIETAIVLKQKGITDFHFIWIGDNCWEVDRSIHDICTWGELEQKIVSEHVKNHITFLSFRDNFYEYFLAGDIFFLSSREDPFPLVCLEAAQCSIPVICFENSGGMPDFVANDAGFVVPYEDVNAAAEKIVFLKNHQLLRTKLGANSREKFLSGYTIDISAPKILHQCLQVGNLHPVVTVIVPNYNYAQFLDERLSSIYNQTFKEFEVIILDDSSTDDSLTIIEKYRSNPNTTVLLNKVNSGSPFRQWQKGIDAAKGRIIWIAESDDFSDPDFLALMLPFFNHPEVALAHCNSNIIDKNNNIIGDYTDYHQKLDFNHWKYGYRVKGDQEMNFGLGVKNSILNVSSVIFRKEAIPPDIFNKLDAYRFSGDWLFYIELLKGRQIACCNKKLNFHRRHSQTLTTQFNTDDQKKLILLQEAAKIHTRVLELCELSPQFAEKWKFHIHEQISAFYPNTKEEDFNKYYPYDVIKNKIKELTAQAAAKKKRWVFLTTNDGAFMGGSEKLWIQAALETKKRGDEVMVVIKKWEPEPDFIDDLRKVGVIILFKKHFDISQIVEFNPSLMIISIGDQDEGIEWYEHCQTSKIPYVILNQLTKEPVYWPVNEELIPKLIKGQEGAEIVLFTGKNNHRVMEKRLGHPITNSGIFYNPTGVERNIKIPYPKSDEVLNIAIVGNLHNIHKGQQLAIELFAKQKWRDRPVHLNIYGKGQDEDKFKRQVHNLNLTNVTFRGYAKELSEVWAQNHAILLSSFMEGLPIVLMSAMLCARVSIATDIGSHTEVIRDNVSGFMAAKPTVDALDEALERAWQRKDEWEKMGMEARVAILKFLPENPMRFFINRIELFSMVDSHNESSAND